MKKLILSILLSCYFSVSYAQQFDGTAAHQFYKKGEYEKARKLFIEMIYKIPADEMRIREIANYFYSIEAYDLAIETFHHGRSVLKNESLFTFELLSLYRFKKDKNRLVQEYVNALGTMPQLLQQAQHMLSIAFESDADYLVLQSLLLKKIQKEPDKEVYTDLLIWQYLQRKDYKSAFRQLVAQDKRTKADGRQVFSGANSFVSNGAYEVAVEAYNYLLSKGKESSYYLPARIELLNTRYAQLSSAVADQRTRVESLAKDYHSIVEEYGKNQKTVFALRKWAELQAYYLDQPEEAVSALEEVLSIPGLPDVEINQLKLDLGDLYVVTSQPWEAVLIYEQVAKVEGQPLSNEARFRSAQLSFYQGNFKYAKSQADVLKASTSQLIANDALNLSLLISDNLQSSADSLALKMYADAEMLQFRKQYPAALIKLDSIPSKYPNNSLEDDVFMAKSKIYILQNEFASAAKALKSLVDLHSSSIWIDDALFTLADLLENKIGDREQAKAMYQRLLDEYPGSVYVAEARKRFRLLRGDAPGI